MLIKFICLTIKTEIIISVLCFSVYDLEMKYVLSHPNLMLNALVDLILPCCFNCSLQITLSFLSLYSRLGLYALKNVPALGLKCSYYKLCRIFIREVLADFPSHGSRQSLVFCSPSLLCKVGSHLHFDFGLFFSVF